MSYSYTSNEGERTGLDQVVDEQLEALLQEMISVEHFSGVAFIKIANRVTHNCAYGLSLEGSRNQLSHRLHVGSLTKQFTAAAILQLVEKERMTLDDPINSLLPQKYRSPMWSQICVRHLLSHTSGIPDYAIERDYYDVTDGWAFDKTIDGMIREAMHSKLNFTPGDRFRYSNIGYTLLGKIIESRTETLFGDYLRNELLAPLGMTESEIHDERFQLQQNDAQGLRWDHKKGDYAKDDIISLPVTPADGGLVTTAGDFSQWVDVYRRMKHPRLSKQSIEYILRPVVSIDANRWPGRDLRGEAHYGLGVMRSGDLVMHEGSIVGFRSFFIYSFEDDVLVAVFSNNTTNDVNRIASRLFEKVTSN